MFREIGVFWGCEQVVADNQLLVFLKNKKLNTRF
jgi:hypothetical protein